MPILSKEPDCHPSDLLDTPESYSEPERRWYALYTRARREKQLMRFLLSQEIPFYGPLVVQKSRTPKGRTIKSFNPLFSGYVFLLGNREDCYNSMKSNCISQRIEVPDEHQIVADLRQIRQLIASEAPITLEKQLAPGHRVRVKTGPFAGVEGVVVRRENKDRLVVAVNFLQQGASVHLEDFQLEKLD